jgi:hypothetical protein
MLSTVVLAPSPSFHTPVKFGFSSDAMAVTQKRVAIKAAAHVFMTYLRHL